MLNWVINGLNIKVLHVDYTSSCFKKEGTVFINKSFIFLLLLESYNNDMNL